jgi:hypothetical protein
MVEKVSAWKTSDGIIHTTYDDAIKSELYITFQRWYNSNNYDKLKCNGNALSSAILFDWLYKNQDEIIKLFMIDKIECLDSNPPNLCHPLEVCE